MLQHLRGGFGVSAVPVASLRVIRDFLNPPRPVPRRKDRRTAKRGGWTGTQWVTWKEICRVSEIEIQLRRNRTPLNVCLSFAPVDAPSLAEAKRIISRDIGHLGQALKRAGCPHHIGLTAYERNRKGKAFDRNGHEGLHAHHALHVPAGFRHVVQRFVDLAPAGERHIRTFDSGGVWYLTKQREALPPDFPAAINGRPHKRELGDFIPGKRLSLTGAAEAIVGPVHAT